MAHLIHHLVESKLLGIVVRYWLTRDPLTGLPAVLIGRVVKTIPEDLTRFIAAFEVFDSDRFDSEHKIRTVADACHQRALLENAFRPLLRALRGEGVDAKRVRQDGQAIVYRFTAPADGIFQEWESYPEGQTFQNYYDYLRTTFPVALKYVHEITDADRYDHADTYRIAKLGDERSELLYRWRYRSGCCGFYDAVHSIDGVVYKIGFNYGH